MDPLDHTTTFGYDNLNRLTAIGYSDSQTHDVAYWYDANGNRTRMTDGTGETDYLYDSMDRLQSVTSPGSRTVAYRYDLDGNRTRVIYPDGTSTVTYSFDEASKLTTLSDWASRAVGYSYNPDGSLQQTTNFNGTTATYSYDNALRLLSVVNRDAFRNGLISSHTYSLDPVGNRTADSSAAVTSGSSWGWGAGSLVGDGTTSDRYLPVDDNLSGPVQASGKWSGSVALTADGRAWGWGANSSGQIGDGTTTGRTAPTLVSGLSDLVAVSSSGYHTLAVKGDGTVWAWGSNTSGRLGLGASDSSPHPTPTQVPGLSGMVAVAAGGTFGLALKSDGTVYAWGSNSYGQLGDNSLIERDSPVQVKDSTGSGYLSGIVAISAGQYHALALASDGTVWGWGMNGTGQLGNNSTSNSSLPVQVLNTGGSAPLGGVVGLSAGWYHSLAVAGDGKIWGWGDDYWAELADGGTMGQQNTPVELEPSSFGGKGAGVSAGRWFSLAALRDGTAWSWGLNAQGQMGIGSADSLKHAAGQVWAPGGSGYLGSVTAITAGGFAAFAMRLPATATDYGYDRLYRLTSADPGSATTYQYDPVGNRSGKGSTTYTYDRADRITAVGGVSYTVNANGNLTARGSDSFGYDRANRLLGATVGTTSATYAYDGDGKRASKTVGSSTTDYLYDVNASLPVLLDDGTRQYVWGLGLAYAVDSSGDALAYHTDGLGSVRALTDAYGSVVQTYQYDEYGNVTASAGSVTQPFGYTGEQADAETGLVYLRARYLDPATGRFTTRDSVSGVAGEPASLGRYAYAYQNPVLLTDPSGHVVPLGKNSILRDQSPLVLAAASSGNPVAPAAAAAAAAAARVAPQISYQLGVEGERLAGIVKNTMRIDSITGAAKYRVPDILDRTGRVIGDVKNVGHLGIRSQLTDFIKYAQEEGYSMVLKVRENTVLTPSLQKLVDDGVVTLQRVLP